MIALNLPAEHIGVILCQGVRRFRKNLHGVVGCHRCRFKGHSHRHIGIAGNDPGIHNRSVDPQAHRHGSLPVMAHQGTGKYRSLFRCCGGHTGDSHIPFVLIQVHHLNVIRFRIGIVREKHHLGIVAALGRGLGHFQRLGHIAGAVAALGVFQGHLHFVLVLSVLHQPGGAVSGQQHTDAVTVFHFPGQPGHFLQGFFKAGAALVIHGLHTGGSIQNGNIVDPLSVDHCRTGCQHGHGNHQDQLQQKRQKFLDLL